MDFDLPDLFIPYIRALWKPFLIRRIVFGWDAFSCIESKTQQHEDN